MPTQPILVVIGIAIAVNLVIMGALVVTLIARRRSSLATPDGIVEPPPYRYSAMATTPPTATSAISFIDDEVDDEDGYDRTDEDFDDDVSATEPADYRRFRPVMSDEGERVESTIESFLTGGSTNAVPPPASPAPTPIGAASGLGAATPIGATTGAAPTPRPAPPAVPTEPIPLPVGLTAASQPPVASQRPVTPASASLPAASADDRLDWEVRLRDEEARLSRYRRPISVVLVEVDGMERLVQRLGPDAAERLVPPVGQTLTRQARGADHVARIGLSRFAVLLPETDEIQAINYVERIRSECDRWLAAGAVATRLAIGWACPTPGGDLRTATRIAEDRLNEDRRRSYVRTDLDFEPAPAAPAQPYPAQDDPAGPIATMELTPPDGAE